MSYIKPIDRQHADASVGATLDALKAKLGKLPNLFLTLANTPVALNAYVQLADAVGHGRFGAKQREQIALAVGEANACEYCLSAHSAIGKMVGLSPAQIAAARDGKSDDARDAAVLALARGILDHRGHVPTAELDAFKAAGFSDGDVLEVLVNVVLNIYTNYANHIARTDVDFPLAAKRLAA
ncbi:MAG TPA: carboxymuconolactone decarboxylase family protein [Rudaea sp.]|nr:carboxymuconolactone decarboxylase family protein [Rudaea sp.]